MSKIKVLLLGIVGLMSSGCSHIKSDAEIKGAIILGDVSTYAGYEVFTHPYRNGWSLAVGDINIAGGINGRPIIVKSRDDAGDKEKALEAARDLKERYDVTALFGTAMFGIGSSLSEFAEQEEIAFLASLPMDDAILSASKRKYTFRLRASSRMQAAMLAQEAAKLPAKRWAIVAPNYAFGWDAVASFKSSLAALRPDVIFVKEILPNRGRFDSKAIVSDLLASKPDAIFNATFGPDLSAFVDGGVASGLFQERTTVSMLGGEPEYAGSFNADALKSRWLVTGYPRHDPESESHRDFVDRYTAKYGVPPTLLALIGYTTMQVISDALLRADQSEVDRLVDVFTKMKVETPAGQISFRDSDHQSTMGAWVGWLEQSENSVIMTDHYYADGLDFMPEYEAP